MCQPSEETDARTADIHVFAADSPQYCYFQIRNNQGDGFLITIAIGIMWIECSILTHRLKSYNEIVVRIGCERRIRHNWS